MDRDDGSKTALRTPNRNDVLVFGPGQTLEHFVWFGAGQPTHDEIIWAIEPQKRSEGAFARQLRTGLGRDTGWVGDPSVRMDW